MYQDKVNSFNGNNLKITNSLKEFLILDYEWTTWFPSSLNSGLTLTPAETLSYLLRHQPDHVCHQVVDTETRKINENLQVRYQCLPGTIKHSDYPSYISEDCKFFLVFLIKRSLIDLFYNGQSTFVIFL